MDWTIVQGGLCKRGACSEWASGLSLAAEQSIGCGVKKHGYGLFTSCTLLKKRCSEWASGLSLAAKQSIGRSQEAWIERLYKVHFVREGHVQSGQVGFPLLLNKALKWGQET